MLQLRQLCAVRQRNLSGANGIAIWPTVYPTSCTNDGASASASACQRRAHTTPWHLILIQAHVDHWARDETQAPECAHARNVQHVTHGVQAEEVGTCDGEAVAGNLPVHNVQ